MEVKKYQAFISYKREDEKWASWLQKKLEHYKIPSVARRQNISIPSFVRPIFKDTTDLSGGLLARSIEQALDNSRYLIVICSPRAAKSPWVSKEVQRFIDTDKVEYIIPFIVEGTPNSSVSEDECFPSNLKSLTGEKELLGININEMGRDAAMVKVVARMFGLQFDLLWNRYGREKRRRLISAICLLVVMLAISLAVAGIIVNKNLELNRQYEKIETQNKQLDSTNVLLGNYNDSLILQHEMLLDANDSIVMQKSMLDIEYAKVRKANREMMVSRGRYIAQIIHQLVDAGELYDAQRLAGEICRQLDKEGLDIHEVDFALKTAFSSRGSYINSSNEASPCEYVSLKTFDAERYKCEYAVFERDASSLLIFGDDGFSGLFDVRTGKKLHDSPLNIHVNGFKMDKILFSPSKLLAAAIIKNSEKEFVVIVDNQTQDFHYYEVNFQLGVNFLEFSSDEKYLAFASSSDEYMVVDILQKQSKYKGKVKSVSFFSSMCFSSDAKKLYFTGLLLPELFTVDLEQNKVMKSTYENKTDNKKIEITECFFARDGRLYVAEGKFMMIINEEDMKAIYRIKSHNYPIKSAAISPGKLLVTGDSKGELAVLDLMPKPSFSHRMKLHNDEITHVDISEDGNWIITTSKDHNAKLLGKFKYIETCDFDYTPEFESVVYKDSLNFLVAGKSSLYEINKISKDIVWTVDFEGKERVEDMAYSAASGLIAVPASDSLISVYSDNGKFKFSLNGNSDLIKTLSFSRDGKYLCSAELGGEILIFDVISKSIYRSINLEATNGLLRKVQFLNDGKHMLACGEYMLSVFDIHTGKRVACYKSAGNRIAYADVNSKGDIVFCSEDQLVKIWNYKTDTLEPYVRWKIKFEGISWSNSGKYIAATSQDGWLKVWNYETSELVLEYHVRGGRCFKPVFNKNDSAVLCMGYTGFNEIVLLDKSLFLNYINLIYSSNPLTDEERRKFYLQ